MLKINNICYQYPKSETLALDEISFQLKAGKNMAVIGESGCGKSSLLKAIYGLIDLNAGEIFFENEKVLGPAYHLVPGHPHMKYLAQDFDLMPFIKVKENVGKFLSNVFLEEKINKIEELLSLVDMTEYAETLTKNLSGGQKQRIALAQALAQEPKLLLLDEPFSHIDHFRKNTLRRQLFQYLKDKDICCLVATHDMADVLPFADEIIILKNGQMAQTGNSQDVYENPKNLEIAKLFGDAFEISEKLATKFNFFDRTILYPHQFKVVENNGVKAKIIKKYFYGTHYLYEALCHDELIMFNHQEDLAIAMTLTIAKINDKIQWQ